MHTFMLKIQWLRQVIRKRTYVHVPIPFSGFTDSRFLPETNGSRPPTAFSSHDISETLHVYCCWFARLNYPDNIYKYIFFNTGHSMQSLNCLV